MTIEVRANQFLSSHDWTENVPCPASPEQMRAWQQRLNAIYGTINGQPVVRIIWGQDPKNWHFNRYYREWTPRYDWGCKETEAVNPVTGVIIKKRRWFGLPRLVLERALKPLRLQVRESEQMKAHRDAQGLSVAEYVPSGPLEYRIWTIQGKQAFLVAHDTVTDKDGNRLCCVRNARKGYPVCYGHYRELDETDLEILRREEEQARLQSRAAAAELIIASPTLAPAAPGLII